MKRPVFVFGIIFIICTAVSVQFSRPAGTALGLLLFFGALLFASRPSAKALAILSAAAVALSWAALTVYDLRTEAVDRLRGESVSFSGFIREASKNGVNSYEVYTVIDGHGRIVWLSDSYTAQPYSPGDWIEGSFTVTGIFEAPRSYFLGGGFALSAQDAVISPCAAPSWSPARRVYHAMVSARQRVLSLMQQHRSGSSAQVVTGMLLSDSSGLSAAERAALSYGGSAHYLSVSGLQLAVSLGLLWCVLQRSRAGRWTRLLLGTAVILIVTASGGFSPYLLRAAIMQFIAMLAMLFGRRSDSMTSLSIAAVLLCCAAPTLAAESGFWLSFSAVLGVAALTIPLHDALSGFVLSRCGQYGAGTDRLIYIVSVITAAQLAITPVYAAAFGYMTPIAVISNLLLYPVLLLIMPLGALSSSAYLAGLAGAGDILLDAACIPADVFVAVSKTAARLPLAVLRLPLFLQCLAAFAVTILFAAALLLRGSRRLRRILSAAGILCLAALFVSSLWVQSKTLLVSDDRTGSAVVTRGDYCILFDASGDEYTAELTYRLVTLYGGNNMLAAVRPPYADLSHDIALTRLYSPRVIFTSEDNAALVQGVAVQVESACQLSGEVNIASWLLVSSPGEYMSQLSCGKINVLKLWAGYGIIQSDDIPSGVDVIIDIKGRAYPLGGITIHKGLSHYSGVLLD